MDECQACSGRSNDRVFSSENIPSSWRQNILELNLVTIFKIKIIISTIKTAIKMSRISLLITINKFQVHELINGGLKLNVKCKKKKRKKGRTFKLFV